MTRQHSLLDFPAPSEYPQVTRSHRENRVPLRWHWVRAQNAGNRASARYHGWLITQDGHAQTSTVSPKETTTTPRPGIVAYKVYTRGGAEVFRLPYTQRMINAINETEQAA